MRRTVIGLIVAAALLAGGVGAQQRKPQEVELQAAIRTETVDGDLTRAIAQYRAIVTKYGADRSTVAIALVRMADCYRLLGDSQARAIYEQLVHDYADQAEPVRLARANLGRTPLAASAGSMASRRVLTTPPGGDLYGAVSPDGRTFSYVDWETGDLAVYELGTSRVRRLTHKGTWAESNQYAESSTFSPDSKQVAYSWAGPEGRYQLRVSSLEARGLPQPRTVFDNADVSWLSPFAWSPDGKLIAVQLTRKDRTDQLGLIRVQDGSLRVLKSSEWRGSTEVFFSPDGRYLALDMPVGESNDQRDVFILAIDGSRETPLAVGTSHDTVIGWSPDGEHVLFASDRGGSIGLWAVPVVDGRPQGPAELLKSDISRNSLGLSLTGSLFLGVGAGNAEITVTSVEPETGKILKAPTRPVQHYVGSNRDPDWSSDGKSLVYVSLRDEAAADRVLGILSLETGKARDLRPALNYFDGPRWAPDGKSVIVRGRDLKNRRGAYRVDAQTGEATPVVVMDEGGVFAPQWSRDGGKLYYRIGVKDPDGTAFIERDLASGSDREVFRHKELLGMPSVSPDGRTIATTVGDTAVVLIPVAGGEPRELLRANHYQPQGVGRLVDWTPDGRAVLVSKAMNERGTQREVLLLPIAGGRPRQIITGPIECCGVRVHPDGRQMAYVAGESRGEVWVLENFLPTSGAKR